VFPTAGRVPQRAERSKKYLSQRRSARQGAISANPDATDLSFAATDSEIEK
jgi:hypothetical protein